MVRFRYGGVTYVNGRYELRTGTNFINATNSSAISYRINVIYGDRWRYRLKKYISGKTGEVRIAYNNIEKVKAMCLVKGSCCSRMTEISRIYELRAEKIMYLSYNLN